MRLLLWVNIALKQITFALFLPSPLSLQTPAVLQISAKEGPFSAELREVTAELPARCCLAGGNAGGAAKAAALHFAKHLCSGGKPFKIMRCLTDAFCQPYCMKTTMCLSDFYSYEARQRNKSMLACLLYSPWRGLLIYSCQAITAGKKMITELFLIRNEVGLLVFNCLM